MTEDDLTQAGLLTTFDVVNGNSDATPPSLVSMTIPSSAITPDGVDVRFEFELSLSDAGAGVSSVRIDLVSPSGVEISVPHILLTPKANPTMLMQSEVLSEHLEMGDWTIVGVMVLDAAGNSVQLVGGLASNTVQVINPFSDNQAPILDMFTIIMNRDIYPLSEGSRISYSIGATDNAAGIEILYINLRGPSGQLLPTRGSFGNPAPLNVLTQADSFEVNNMMEEGVWAVESIELIDEAGNSRLISDDELHQMGYDNEVNVLY